MENRRELLHALAALPALSLLASDTGKWANSVTDAYQAKVTKEPYGELRVYHDGPTEQLKQMVAGSVLLHPGQSPHPPHQHPDEEFMVVTEGTGEMVVDGKTSKIAPGSLMYCGGNRLHGITNTGQGDLTFYYFKWRA